MQQLDIALPTGEVTFVFTDIEGSTRLLRRHGDQYEQILQRHREILRSAWLANSGHELGTEGDSFFVAFADVEQALFACRTAQADLQREEWPEHAELRVRMGIHRGLAHPRDGEYVALAVHRAARVAAAAHGGQILVSEQAAAATSTFRDELDPLGRFRVRDFDAPVGIYSVRLSTDAATRPPRLVPAEGHNLVRPVGSLFGREPELEETTSLLTSGKAVSLLGPGGVGKTRLAIEIGLRCAVDWPAGVWFVELAPVRDPSLIPTAITEAIGAADVRDATVWDSIRNHFGDEEALLVLDNCEHLHPGCAAAIETLLARCPGLCILATSRESLGLIGETTVRVGPLETLAAGPEPSQAARLFLDRSPRSIPDEETNLPAVAELCAALDGLPLAIELAAGRAAHLSPAEILEAVRERPSSIRSRDPGLPGRHMSLTRVLDWSYQLLLEDEAELLTRLATFASSFDVELATTAAGTAVDPASVPELLWSLADKSLIHVERAAGASRYRLLNTVRAYVTDRSSASDEAGRLLVEHYVSTLGPDQAMDIAWSGRVGLELDNLRALAQNPHSDNHAQCQQLAWSIGRHHDMTDKFSVGISELESLISVLDRPSPERVALLTLLADLYLRLDRPSDDADWHPLERAKTIVDEAGELAQRVGVAPWDDAGVARTKGTIALREGDPKKTLEIAHDALRRELSERGQARVYSILGVAAGHSGDLDLAIRALTRELELWKSLQVDAFVASTHGNLAEALLQSDPAAAARHQLESLDLALELGNRLPVAFSMVVAAHLAAGEEHWPEALELQGAADALLEELKFSLFPPDLDARRALIDAACAHEYADRIDDLLSNGRRRSSHESTELARVILESTVGGPGK